MAVISVSIELQEKRSIFLNVSTSPPHGLTDHKDILGINVNTRNEVTTSVELIIVRSALLTGSHSIVIILTNVNHW